MTDSQTVSTVLLNEINTGRLRYQNKRPPKMRLRRGIRAQVRKATTQISQAQALIMQEWRQIRRAFREFELPESEAEALMRARNEGREKGEVVGYLDLGRARFAAMRRGIESGMVSVEVIEMYDLEPAPR